MEAPIVTDPTPDDRIEHPRQIFKGSVGLQVHALVVYRRKLGFGSGYSPRR